MSTNVAVVIPFHKNELNLFEKISLAQVLKVLGKYPIIFAIPEGANFSWIPKHAPVIHCPYLGQGTGAYNKLLMSPQFYENFLAYDYILIYHLDAFVFSDKLEYFCSLGYDNIGAAWAWTYAQKIKLRGLKFRLRVGNGGFCLRKVKACRDLLANHPAWVKSWKGAEDVFFGLYGIVEGSGFRTAPISVAYKFAAEFNIAHCAKKNGGELPFGCHAWHRTSAYFEVQKFLPEGYSLPQLKVEQVSGDLNGLKSVLLNLAITRLNRRINRRQNLSHYLPEKSYGSIRVIRHQHTISILSRLLAENPKLSDRIFLYDEKNLNSLIEELREENSSGTNLLLTPINKDLDEKILAALKNTTAFNLEYFSCLKNLLQKFGRAD